MKIIALGDIHGEWQFLTNLIQTESPDIILQCGDYGFWPRFNSTGIHCENTKIYWCDGNHEDHWTLNQYTKNYFNQITKNCFYMKRGSVLRLPSGELVLFIGGALSIDRHLRTIGYDWFPEEIITQKDIYNLPDVKVDIVVSHTCPLFFDVDACFTEKISDPSRVALNTVFELYKPKKWFFGHFHKTASGKYENCEWTCLDQKTFVIV